MSTRAWRAEASMHQIRRSEALASVERAARRLRSAEAKGEDEQVEDQRLALDQAVAAARDDGEVMLSDIADAAGLPLQAILDAISRRAAQRVPATTA